jgi:hypothetical protein
MLPAGEVKRVNGVVPGLAQPVGEAARQLGVDQEVHAATDSMRFTWLRRAAKVSTARMSSRSRSS